MNSYDTETKQAGWKFRPLDVVEVLEQKYKFFFKDEIGHYICQHARDFGLFSEEEYLKVLSCDFVWIKSVLGQPLSDVKMELIFKTVVESVDARCTRTVFAAVGTSIDLRPCHSGRLVLSIRPYQIGEKDPYFDAEEAVKLSRYLIPYVKNSELSGMVMRILDDFYPEDLGTSDEPVSGEKLIGALGLNSVSLPFPRGDGEEDMGRIQFTPEILSVEKEDGTESDYVLDSGTILVNDRECRTSKEKNETELHEAKHFLFDRYFYFLQIMGGKRELHSFGRSRTDVAKYQRGGTTDKSNWTEYDWMEYYAEKFQIYAILNEKQTRRFIERQLQEFGGARNRYTMERCIEGISAQFNVSKTEAKIRMIELGYPEAELAYSSYGSRAPEEELTIYCIGRDDLTELIVSDKDLADIVSSGRYRYVDGYLCLNEPEYLIRSGDSFRMTEYACSHLEDCCVAFAVKKVSQIRSRYSSAERLTRYAARTRKVPVTNKYLAAPVFKKEPLAAERKLENSKAFRDAIRWADLEAKLPENFHDALSMIMEAKGLTQEEVALRLGVSKPLISKVANSAHPSLSHVVGICVAIGMPYYIANDLIEISGNNLRPNGVRRVYKNFLACPMEYSIERCNEILIQSGYDPFFKTGRNKQ